MPSPGTYRRIVSNSSTLDDDVAAYISAAGITNPTEVNAANFLIRSWKGIDLSFNPTGVDLWTDTKILYPFLGGTASSNKWNARDARDADAAFRIVFSGGWTYDSNGITGNGVNTSAVTYYTPSTHGNVAEMSYGRYVRTNSKVGISYMGSFSNTPSQSGFYEFCTDAAVLADMGVGNYSAGICQSLGGGPLKFVVTRREGTFCEVIQNGVVNANSKNNAVTLLPNPVFNLGSLSEDGGLNANYNGYNNALFYAANFGTQAKVQLARNICDKFQLMLGRNV